MTAKSNFFTRQMLVESVLRALTMLSPKVQWKNPVMFVTYICAISSSIYTFYQACLIPCSWFNFQISVWLWFTVIFANMAEAIAESRGKAQAASLRQSKIESFARLIRDGATLRIASTELKKGDVILCSAGDIIPADGEVISGVASIDESPVTGESAPVVRESGGDRSAVTAGTKVLSDEIQIRVTCDPGASFLDRMINLIEGAKRQKTPNEIALTIVLSSLSVLFIVTTAAMKMFRFYSNAADPFPKDEIHVLSIPVLIALIVCLIPTTISALLSAVGIAGMDRLIRRNVIAKSGTAVETAGDIDMLILDKTGTITLGNRMASAFIPAPGVSDIVFAKVATLSSLSDETPEGRSVLAFGHKEYGIMPEKADPACSLFIPFSAKTRMSGMDFTDENGKVIRSIRKGATDQMRRYVESIGGIYPNEIDSLVKPISSQGGTPLLVSDGNQIVGIIQLKDIIKPGIKERFEQMRKMGIKTVMITGDNALTAAAIAAEAGVDEYVAEATPEIKLTKIRHSQEAGHLVAMTGDGTNDAPALAQSDVGVALNTGTQAAREASNMVDLDSNPTKLLEIVEIGKQMLITRGALTTFSIANDLAKYFAIIPAIFSSLYAAEGSSIGPLSRLNIMHLHSPQSAILSAVIFNALIIIALIPLALRGVSYKSLDAMHLLRRNLLVFGLGGVIAPFIGIKLIDLIITNLKIV